MEKDNSWITKQYKYKSNEKKRPGKEKLYSDIFGMEGSFRQLSVDWKTILEGAMKKPILQQNTCNSKQPVLTFEIKIEKNYISNILTTPTAYFQDNFPKTKNGSPDFENRSWFIMGAKKIFKKIGQTPV